MPSDAWISRKGLIFGGTVYLYSGLLYKCDGVVFKEASASAPEFFSRLSEEEYYFEITVPVPKEEEQDARVIVSLLSEFPLKNRKKKDLP